MNIHLHLPFPFWSWQLAAILIVLSVIGLCVGSLPDNGRKPVGDAFRYPVWILTALYFVGATLRGIGLFPIG